MRLTFLLFLAFSTLAHAGSYGDDPCAGKKKCATIYVSPWCPYCKKAEGTFREYLKANSPGAEFGVRLVVGAGRRPGDNEAYARTFGFGGLADDSGAWKRQLDAHAYPSFYVQDEAGQVVMRDGVARLWVDTTFGPK